MFESHLYFFYWELAVDVLPHFLIEFLAIPGLGPAPAGAGGGRGGRPISLPRPRRGQAGTEPGRSESGRASHHLPQAQRRAGVLPGHTAEPGQRGTRARPPGSRKGPEGLLWGPRARRARLARAGAGPSLRGVGPRGLLSVTRQRTPARTEAAAGAGRAALEWWVHGSFKQRGPGQLCPEHGSRAAAASRNRPSGHRGLAWRGTGSRPEEGPPAPCRGSSVSGPKEMEPGRGEGGGDARRLPAGGTARAKAMVARAGPTA